jgi:hypothetical protein
MIFGDKALKKLVAGIAVFLPLLFGAQSRGVCAQQQQQAPSAPAPEWKSLETNCFVVYYRPDADLRRIARRLSERIFYFNRSSGYDDDTPEGKARYRLDALFNKAQDILDMRPGMPRISIRIFRDRDELNGEYLKLCHARQDFKSYYIHSYRTIYTSEEDISDSVVAHEMGHSIVDAYFSALPPPKIAEVLAQYVDVHLED